MHKYFERITTVRLTGRGSVYGDVAMWVKCSQTKNALMQYACEFLDI